MKQFALLSTFERGLLHRVVVRHAIADQAIPTLSAQLIDAPREWTVAVLQGDVVVAGPLQSDTPPSSPSARLVVDPAIAAYLDTAGGLDIDLDAPEINHTLDPADQRIQVRLLTSGGDPSPDQVVTVHANASGSSRPTTEISPGLYRTELTRFTASWRRFAVRLDDQPIGTTSQLQNYRTTTAVTVIEP